MFQSNRASRSGDFAPKWRFLMGQWRQKFVAIRHAKSGDFGKFVESYQKVAIFGQKMAILTDFFSETFGLSNFPKLRLNLQKLVTQC